MAKVNKVLYNLNQRNDTTVQERTTARNNIDAAENKGFVECYRSFSDGSFVDTWFKICEMNVGTGSNYSYGYELALKLVVTNNGDGDCPCESATMNMGCNFVPAINLGRSEVAWSDHTANDHAECSIDGVKILTHRASSNYGPRDKIEVWLKATKYFTYYTQMRVECIANAGNQCYRSTTSVPTMLVLPWQFRNGMITGTHTDPFNDASHPAASAPGAEGWSEVYYPCETKTVMVDHDQNFTLTEQATARNNIGASDGMISWVEYNPGSPTPTVEQSTLSVVSSEQGTRVQNNDASKKFYIAPDFSTPEDTGKFFGIGIDGQAKWMKVPNPPKDIFIDQYSYDLKNIGSNTAVLKTISIPTGTTKIIGTLDCYPNSGYESLSILTRKNDNSLYNASGTVNVTHLIALDGDASGGQYRNTVPFQFKVTGNPNDGVWSQIAIKGQANSITSNYNLSNIMITFIKES